MPDLPPLSTDQVAAFVEQARRGSLWAAAETLCLTEQGVRHRLVALEARLGAELYRKGRGSAPPPPPATPAAASSVCSPAGAGGEAHAGGRAVSGGGPPRDPVPACETAASSQRRGAAAVLPTVTAAIPSGGQVLTYLTVRRALR
jgi:hypothetical protein